MTHRCLSRVLSLTLARTIALGACALASAACGASSDGAAREASAASPGAAASTSAGQAISEIELQVTGGPLAGRYTATVTEGGCSYDLIKPGMWGHAYSAKGDGQDPKELTGVDLMVPDSKAAADGTTNFLLRVSFGPYMGGTIYQTDTRSEFESEKEGDGTVKVEDRGSSGTVTFDAKTKDGVGLKGTIKCHSVLRGG